MASLDLNAAFDVFDVNLPLKRLRTIEMPNDIVDLIEYIAEKIPPSKPQSRMVMVKSRY